MKYNKESVRKAYKKAKVVARLSWLTLIWYRQKNREKPKL